jgi:hypothetical protein
MVDPDALFTELAREALPPGLQPMDEPFAMVGQDEDEGSEEEELITEREAANRR